MTSDRELLRRYAREGDEAAFAEVVRRQADLVYSVALRMARDTSLAQDVTQTVFIKLAGRAGFLCHYDTVVGWLHTATRHCAIDAIRAEARRRAREQEASTMHDTALTPEANWEIIGPLLDEAVGSLREDDRKAVLLRYFKNLSHQQIGAELGLNENSANKRIERALEKLRDYFARRGVTATASVLAAAISTNSVQAAPAGLVATVAKASLAGASPTAESVFLKILFMSTKTKIGLAGIIILALAATLAIKLQTSRPPADSAPAAKPPAMTAVKPPLSPPRIENSVPVAVLERKPPAATQPAEEFAAVPKANLNEAIASAIYFLERKDFVGLAKTLVPPDVVSRQTQSGGASSMEDYVAKLVESPGFAQKTTQMLDGLRFVQGEAPAMSADGATAIYTFTTPDDKNFSYTFKNVNGLWYLETRALWEPRAMVGVFKGGATQ